MPARRLGWTVTAALLPGLALSAQDGPVDATPAEVTIGQRGSEQDPLAGRRPVLSIEPVRDPAGAGPGRGGVEAMRGVPALSIKADPRVLGVVPGEPLPRLRREGEALRRRDGQLLPSGDRGYAVFIAEADPEAGDDTPVPMVVAPCMMLESMERLLEDRGDELRFTITGQVHTYRGVNYLLPTAQPKPWLISQGRAGEVVVDEAAGADAERPVDAAPDQAAKPGPAAPGPPGDPPPGDKAAPTADEVMGELLQERVDAPEPVVVAEGGGVLQGLPPSTSGAGGAIDPLLLGLDPDQPQAELKDEGQFVTARTGRLVRSADGSHALFVFDADQAGSPEPPMILHACKLLETMEKTVLKQGDDVPFVISGQVFVYRGANYLLPTIVKREFDRGNLK